MPDRDADLSLLLSAALTAGTIAMRYWKKPLSVRDKGDGAGPVTEADLAVDAQLQADLTAARPTYGWMSEESADTPERAAADTVFIVDPIDGTRAFVAGEAAFAISVAVAHRGAVTAAVVHLPALDLTYAAHTDGMATLNSRPIRVSPREALAGAELLANRASLAPDLWPGGVPPVERKFRSSLAWRLCLAAEGRFDAMLTLRDAWEWDVAAGALIATRAGASVTDGDGLPLRFNNPARQVPGLIAAPPVLHAQLLALRAG